MSNLSRRLVESEDLRVKLEEAPELFQSTNDKVTGSEREARYLKLSREELNTRLTETEAALAAVQRTNPILVAEIKKRHDHANNIVETWRVVKATMEGLQCGEPKPRTSPLLRRFNNIGVMQSQKVCDCHQRARSGRGGSESCDSPGGPRDGGGCKHEQTAPQPVRAHRQNVEEGFRPD